MALTGGTVTRAAVPALMEKGARKAKKGCRGKKKGKKHGN